MTQLTDEEFDWRKKLLCGDNDYDESSDEDDGDGMYQVTHNSIVRRKRKLSDDYAYYEKLKKGKFDNISGEVVTVVESDKGILISESCERGYVTRLTPSLEWQPIKFALDTAKTAPRINLIEVRWMYHTSDVSLLGPVQDGFDFCVLRLFPGLERSYFEDRFVFLGPRDFYGSFGEGTLGQFIKSTENYIFCGKAEDYVDMGIDEDVLISKDVHQSLANESVFVQDLGQYVVSTDIITCIMKYLDKCDKKKLPLALELNTHILLSALSTATHNGRLVNDFRNSKKALKLKGWFHKASKFLEINSHTKLKVIEYVLWSSDYDERDTYDRRFGRFESDKDLTPPKDGDNRTDKLRLYCFGDGIPTQDIDILSAYYSWFNEFGLERNSFVNHVGRVLGGRKKGVEFDTEMSLPFLLADIPIVKLYWRPLRDGQRPGIERLSSKIDEEKHRQLTAAMLSYDPKLELTDDLKRRLSEECPSVEYKTATRRQMDKFGSKFGMKKFKSCVNYERPIPKYVVIWDVETFTPTGRNVVTPYAVAAIILNVKMVEDFVSHCLKVKHNSEKVKYNPKTVRDLVGRFACSMAQRSYSEIEKDYGWLYHQFVESSYGGEGVRVFTSNTPHQVSCMTQFMSWLVSQSKEIRTDHYKECRFNGSYDRWLPILTYAFNGSRFDNHLFVHALDEFNSQHEGGEKLMLGNNLGMKKLTINVNPENGSCYPLLDFRDVLDNIAPCSLREACGKGGFQAPNAISKGDFNFFKVRSWNDVDKWEHEFIPYLINDVLSTAWVVTACNISRVDVTRKLLGDDPTANFSLYSYLTQAQMAESFIFRHSGSIMASFGKEVGKLLNRMVMEGGKVDVFDFGDVRTPFAFSSEQDEVPHWLRKFHFFTEPQCQRDVDEIVFTLGAFPSQSKRLLFWSTFVDREEDELKNIFDSTSPEYLFTFAKDPSNLSFDRTKFAKWLMSSKTADNMVKCFTDEDIHQYLMEGGYHEELNYLEGCTQKSSQFGEDLDAVYGSVKRGNELVSKWKLDEHPLDKFTFFEMDINSLYPAVLATAPLPIGIVKRQLDVVHGGHCNGKYVFSTETSGLNRDVMHTTNDEVARAWLYENPSDEAPFISKSIPKFPISHYGLYRVTMNPPENASQLSISVISKHEKKVTEKGVKVVDPVIDWHNFEPVSNRWLDSYTIWVATEVQKWKLVKIHEAIRYHSTYELSSTYKQLYDTRLQMKQDDSSTLQASTIKLLMNSSYGRLSMIDKMHDDEVSTLLRTDITQFSTSKITEAVCKAMKRSHFSLYFTKLDERFGLQLGTISGTLQDSQFNRLSSNWSVYKALTDLIHEEYCRKRSVDDGDDQTVRTYVDVVHHNSTFREFMERKFGLCILDDSECWKTLTVKNFIELWEMACNIICDFIDMYLQRKEMSVDEEIRICYIIQMFSPIVGERGIHIHPATESDSKFYCHLIGEYVRGRFGNLKQFKSSYRDIVPKLFYQFDNETLFAKMDKIETAVHNNYIRPVLSKLDKPTVYDLKAMVHTQIEYFRRGKNITNDDAVELEKMIYDHLDAREFNPILEHINQNSRVFDPNDYDMMKLLKAYQRERDLYKSNQPIELTDTSMQKLKCHQQTALNLILQLSDGEMTEFRKVVNDIIKDTPLPLKSPTNVKLHEDLYKCFEVKIGRIGNDEGGPELVNYVQKVNKNSSVLLPYGIKSTHQLIYESILTKEKHQDCIYIERVKKESLWEIVRDCYDIDLDDLHWNGLDKVYNQKYSINDQYHFTTQTGHVNKQPQQVGAACTSTARALMHIIEGDLLATPIKTLKERGAVIYYQDTDSNYVSPTVARIWNSSGLLHYQELGLFKNDTLKEKSGNATYVLGYFLGKKMKFCIGRNHTKKEWQESFTMKGASKKGRSPIVLELLFNCQHMANGGKVEFEKTMSKMYQDSFKSKDEKGNVNGLGLNFRCTQHMKRTYNHPSSITEN